MQLVVFTYIGMIVILFCILLPYINETTFCAFVYYDTYFILIFIFYLCKSRDLTFFFSSYFSWYDMHSIVSRLGM